MSNFNLSSFSKNLKKARIKLGLTLDEISKILEVGKSAYYKYENGSRFPKPEILFAILSNFDININYLLSGEGEMFINNNHTETLPDNNTFNTSIMREIIETVESLFEEHDRYLPPEKKAKLITLIYEDIMDDQSRKDKIINNIPRLLEAIS